MSKRFFVELYPRTGRDGDVQQVWVSGDEDLEALLRATAKALKTRVEVLYHSKTMNKILSLQDITNYDDVLIATSSYDIDPFKGIRGQANAEPPKEREIATVKISILGMPRIGKSALALRFCVSDFLANYETTIEEEFERRVVVGGVTVDASVLDTAGQEAFQALRSGWIKGRDAFVLGFSVENPNLADLKEFSDLIQLYSDTPKPPIALVATKIDLLKGPQASDAVFEPAQKLAEQNGWMFFKTSAMGNVGVKETFEGLICKVLGISLEGPFSPGGRGELDGTKDIPGLIPCPPSKMEREVVQIPAEGSDNNTGRVIKPKPVPPEGGFFSKLAKLLCG